MMDWINFLIGIILIIPGVFSIILFQNNKSKNKTGSFSFKLRSGGIGLIMIGIYLIYQSIKIR